MFCKCPAVCVAGLTAFRLAEIGTFQRSPQYEFGKRVAVSHVNYMIDKRCEVESANVLCEVQGIRVVRCVARYRVLVVVHAGYDAGAFLTMKPRPLYSCTRSSGSAEQVYV